MDIGFSINGSVVPFDSSDTSQIANHKSCIYGGLIKNFEDSTFTEYLVEVDRNNYIYSEDTEEKLFKFGEIMETIKKELVYVEN